MGISITDLTTQLLIRATLLATIVHEYGHLLAARALGLYAEIRSTHINCVYPDWSSRPPLTQPEHILLYGAGGYFQALVFATLCIRNRDPENVWINKWIIVEGIIYGTFEALLPHRFWNFGASLGILMALALSVVFIIWRKPKLIP